jgi:hypothetical protein
MQSPHCRSGGRPVSRLDRHALRPRVFTVYQANAGLTLIRCGGHFAGSAVLHWAHGGDGSAELK